MAGSVTKTGVVKAVQGSMALVVTKAEPECQGCKARDACTATGGGGANVEVRVHNTAGAKVGDIVIISMKGSSLLKASFLVYMVPIIALIGGIILGHSLSGVISIDKDLLVGILGLLAFLGAFIWVKKKGDKLSGSKEFIPEIVSKKPARQEISPDDIACPVK